MTPRRSSVARRVLRLAALLILPYLLVMGLLAGCQRHLIYFPRTATEMNQRAEAAATGLLPWVDAAGQTIGWRGEPPAGRPRPAARLLVVHGNAGSAVDRAYFVRGFGAVGGGGIWEVSILEYPGYGARPGQPGEASLMAAAHEAVQQLQREDDRPVHVLGESLGSGVAGGLAAAFPDAVKGLVLITPFTRLPDVGSHHYPWLPVRLILRDRYDTVAALERYRGPVAIVVAGRDQVIPAEFGRRLYATYAGPKRLWEQAAAGHNTLDYHPGAAWWSEVSEFLLHAKPVAQTP